MMLKMSTKGLRLSTLWQGGLIGDSVIGHGIGGINFPDIVARLAKMQDHWSKRWRACLSSPDLEASQISDGSKIQVRLRHVLQKDATISYVHSYHVRNTFLRINYLTCLVSTMASSGFGPYHGMLLEDAQTKCIGPSSPHHGRWRMRLVWSNSLHSTSRPVLQVTKKCYGWDIDDVADERQK